MGQAIGGATTGDVPLLHPVPGAPDEWGLALHVPAPSRGPTCSRNRSAAGMYGPRLADDVDVDVSIVIPPL